MKKTTILAGLILALLPMAAMAAPAVRYKAACGMTYSAADAKKYHYVCPMDKSKLVPIKAAHK